MPRKAGDLLTFTMGETKVLAAPRLWVLNRQLADVQLGNPLGYRTRNPKDGTWTEKSIFIGTLLKVRPFVSADDMVRLEVFVERSTGHMDSHGIPQTNAIQILTNVQAPNGTTFAMCGRSRTEVKQDRSPWSLLSCILLNWIPHSDSLFPSTDYVVHKQLIVFLTSHVVRR